jgi:tetratricopeptide (TPR) repeat protein
MSNQAQWHGHETGDRGRERASTGYSAQPYDEVVLTGEVSDLYERAVHLLESGDPEAAVRLLERAVSRVPRSRAVLEAFARAQFDAEHYPEAAQAFQSLAEAYPHDDYAQFGWGLAAARLGEYEMAVEHLALAAAMRPDVRYYSQALRGARATVRAKTPHGAGRSSAAEAG